MGHAPTGQFCYLYALKLILVHSEELYLITGMCGHFYIHGRGGETTEYDANALLAGQKPALYCLGLQYTYVVRICTIVI